jgi:hypothetical protein
MASPTDPRPSAFAATADTWLAQASLDDHTLESRRSAEDCRFADTIEQARDGSRPAIDRLLEELSSESCSGCPSCTP